MDGIHPSAKDHKHESLTEQLAQLRKMAEAEGLLTAADFIGEWLFLKEANKGLDN
jgi:hypothetical protein